jgi:hypothetical protein
MSKASELAEFGGGISSGPNAVEGLAKAWVNFNGTGTIAVRDSSNVSSLTDAGTANYGPNTTSAFNNANYSCAGSALEGANTFFRGITERNTTYSRSTSRIMFHTGHLALSYEEDCEIVTCNLHGDLA